MTPTHRSAATYHAVRASCEALGWMMKGALQRATHAIGITIRMIILQLAQDRDAHQVGRVAQQRYDFAVPYVDEGIRAGPP